MGKKIKNEERKIHMKIKVLYIMPNKEVQKIKIPRNMKFIKALIGNELLRIKINENTMIIADKNADITEFNRIFKDSIIRGTFIVVSIKNKRRVTMTKREIRRYANMFKLKKHKRKIELYKEEYLEKYYLNETQMREKAIKENKGITSKVA